MLTRRLLVVALIAAANLSDRDILFTYLVSPQPFFGLHRTTIKLPPHFFVRVVLCWW